MKTKLFGLFACLLISNRCLAEINWTLWMNGGESHGIDIATDDRGNSYVAGMFVGGTSLGANALASAGGTDVFVAKVDASGQVIWTRTLGGTNDDSVSTISATPEGTVFITGACSAGAQFGDASTTEQTQGGPFLAKLSRDGSVEWVRFLSNAIPEAASLGPNRRFWILDKTEGVVAIGWNPDGEPVGSVRLQLPSISADDLAVGMDGAFYVAGSTPLVAKFNRKGDLQWSANPIANTSARSRSSTKVAVGRDGTVAAIGDVDFPFAGGGGYISAGFYLATFAAAGQQESLRIFGEYKGSYSGHDVTVDRNGNPFVAGRAIASYAGPTPYYVSALVIAPTFDYDFQSAYPYDDNHARGICVDSKGYLYVTGDFTGMVQLGSDVVGSSQRGGAPHTFVLRIDDASLVKLKQTAQRRR